MRRPNQSRREPIALLGRCFRFVAIGLARGEDDGEHTISYFGVSDR